MRRFFWRNVTHCCVIPIRLQITAYKNKGLYHSSQGLHNIKLTSVVLTTWGINWFPHPFFSLSELLFAFPAMNYLAASQPCRKLFGWLLGQPKKRCPGCCPPRVLFPPFMHLIYFLEKSFFYFLLWAGIPAIDAFPVLFPWACQKKRINPRA